MKLATLETIFNTYKDHPILSSQVEKFISKYKSKVDDLNPEQLYEFIEQSELFKYPFDGSWPKIEKSLLVNNLQECIASEIYENKPPNEFRALERLISILAGMYRYKILNKENFIELIGKNEKTIYLAGILSTLHERKLYNTENRNKIIALCNQSNQEILRRFQIVLCHIWYHEKINHQELFDILIKFPIDANELESGIRVLGEILNENNLELLFKYSKNAFSVACGLKTLTESKLNTDKNIDAILLSPSSASEIADSLNILQQAGLLSDKNRSFISEKRFLFSFELRVLLKNNILTGENVELIFNIGQERLNFISLWIARLDEKKLLTQSNFFKLLKYVDVFSSNKLREECRLLLNSRFNCYEAFQHLLINLTQDILDAFFKICEDIEEKGVTIKDTINKIIQYVKQLHENQNGWYSRLESKIKNIKFLFEEFDKKPENMDCPWFFENRNAIAEVKELLFGAGEKSILNKGSKEACFDCVIDYLNNRWNLIKETPLAYPYTLSLPITKICIALADAVASELKISLYKILMPSIALDSLDTIQCEPTSQILEHKELQLHQFVLDDKNQRPIYVLGSLDAAKEDGILKHTHLFNNQAECLSEQEVYRVANHCQEAKKYFDIIKEMDDIRRKGSSIGSAIYRLITRLRDGGAHGDAKGKTERKGQESNSGADANEGIFEFDQLLNILSPEEKSYLFSRRAPGKTDNFETCWGRVARPQSAEFERFIYCVELTAVALENILNTNKDLFTLYPKNKNEQIKINLEVLERDASEASAQLDQALTKITFTPLNNYLTHNSDNHLTHGFGQAAKLLWQRLFSNEKNWEKIFIPFSVEARKEGRIRLMLESCPMQYLSRFVKFAKVHSEVKSSLDKYYVSYLDNRYFQQAFTEGHLSVFDFLKLNPKDICDLEYLFTTEGLEALKQKKITVKQFLQLDNGIPENLRRKINKYFFIGLIQNLVTMGVILDFPFNLQSSLRHLLCTPYGLVALQKNYIRFDHCKQLSELYKHPDDFNSTLGIILSEKGLKYFDNKLVSMSGWLEAAAVNKTERYRETAEKEYIAINKEKFFKLDAPIKLSIMHFLSSKSKADLASTNKRWNQFMRF